MLMAFLQRIVNGGGHVEREYGLGRGALDLVLEWHGARHAVEVKLRRDTETEQDAFEQLARYLDSLGLDEGWLVLFDLRSTSCVIGAPLGRLCFRARRRARSEAPSLPRDFPRLPLVADATP